jgi:hypothetical protein
MYAEMGRQQGDLRSILLLFHTKENRLKIPTGRRRRTWEDDTKMELNDTGWKLYIGLWLRTGTGEPSNGAFEFHISAGNFLTM